MRDPVAVVFRIIGPVDAQEALTIVRVPAIIARAFISMGGSELALNLPEEIGALLARTDTFEQRGVLLVNGGPVYARHILIPEVFSLEPPGLGEHLAPFRRRLNRDFYALQVQPATLPAGPLAVILGLLGGFEDTQATKFTIQQCLCIS